MPLCTTCSCPNAFGIVFSFPQDGRVVAPARLGCILGLAAGSPVAEAHFERSGGWSSEVVGNGNIGMRSSADSIVEGTALEASTW